MRVKAKFTPHTKPEGHIKFNLTVLHRCVRNVIYPEDPVELIEYIMQVKKPIPTIYIIPEWKQKLEDCGDIHYRATLSGGQPLPSFIKFNRQNRELIVSQSSDIQEGLYKVFIDGYLEKFPETKDYING